ncbi:heterokaryon incompatibility protein-domain-containing protein [Neurospora hispaniola]|uniref:Heterokaryon incompatibility protein-domain-containing protein n=1 Tax=Neurospora hispaniola TaxID=588809 RepID=A0AAJ0IAW6_9PEZI|nr:heterokaryon incompatibility protein-domain-containing protein [Neurospora hispaniola]
MDYDYHYKYQRIDLSTDAIRLVRLLKGFHRDPIHCELFETFLHQVEGVPYEALSYAWGDSPVACEIVINDRRSPVKENLHMALLALRQTYEDRVLWIDAICIDQSNDKEKGHQVGQMRLIYQCAQRVVVWLGPSNLDIDFLMNTTAQWDYQTRQRPGAQHKQSWIDSWTAFTADETGLYKEEVTARRCNSLKEILDRPWFRRVWILQEVASANKATILCGSKAMSSQGFGLLPSLLGFEPDPHIEAVLDILPGFRRKESWWDEKQTLETLLLKFGTSEATDHRDNIYALLGIASDARASNTLLPDYTVPLSRAICHTISFLLFDEAYDPSAHKLPENLDFPTFRRIIPTLPDYILCWEMRSGNDVRAAALVPKAVDINKYYRPSDPAPVTGLSPLGFTIRKSKLDNTFWAILARHDADILLSTSQLCGYETNFHIFGDFESEGHAPKICQICGGYLRFGHQVLEGYAFERLKHILQHPSAGKRKVKDLQPLFHYAALTSQPKIWELLFEVTHCIDLETSIDSLTEALSDKMGDIPDCTRHSTAVYEWFDDSDGWTIKFVRLMDFFFRRRRTLLDQFQCADELVALFAILPPASLEEAPDYLWHDHLLSINKDRGWKVSKELAEYRLISEQLLSQVPGRVIGEVDVIPSKELNPMPDSS